MKDILFSLWMSCLLEYEVLEYALGWRLKGTSSEYIQYYYIPHSSRYKHKWLSVALLIACNFFMPVHKKVWYSEFDRYLISFSISSLQEFNFLYSFNCLYFQTFKAYPLKNGFAKAEDNHFSKFWIILIERKCTFFKTKTKKCHYL